MIDAAERHGAHDLAALADTLSLRIGRIAVTEKANV